MLYEKFISSLLFFSTLVSSISTKRKSLSNYFLWYKVSIVFLISITLVCSSLYVLPSAFSTTYPSPSHSSSKGIFSDWGGQYSGADGQMRSPAGIAVDSSSGNVYVADTGNNGIQVFSTN